MTSRLQAMSYIKFINEMRSNIDILSESIVDTVKALDSIKKQLDNFSDHIRSIPITSNEEN